MGERAAPVDVAERPDARNVGAQLLVDTNMAARIGRNAGLIPPEVARIRHPTDGKQDMRARDLPRLLFAAYVNDDVAAAARERYALRIQAEGDTLGLEDRLDRR